MIGVGYWGPNLIRNFSELDDARVVACSDLSQERLNKISKRVPGIKCTTNFEELLNDSEVDAVVIATPVSTHFPIAKAALEHGKHVMIEKPLADSADNALALVELAKKYDRILMVDHTFIYTSAVRKIRELLDSGDLGEVLYFDSVRVNLGLFQKDINVIWDLAPHDRVTTKGRQASGTRTNSAARSIIARTGVRCVPIMLRLPSSAPSQCV